MNAFSRALFSLSPCCVCVLSGVSAARASYSVCFACRVKKCCASAVAPFQNSVRCETPKQTVVQFFVHKHRKQSLNADFSLLFLHRKSTSIWTKETNHIIYISIIQITRNQQHTRFKPIQVYLALKINGFSQAGSKPICYNPCFQLTCEILQV